MKRCWQIKAKIKDPKTGDVLFVCWIVRREWFWVDALDVVTKDVEVKAALYPEMFYELIDVREV